MTPYPEQPEHEEARTTGLYAHKQSHRSTKKSEHEEARRLEQAKDIARRGYTPSATWAARVILDAFAKAEQERDEAVFELATELAKERTLANARERELERLREMLRPFADRGNWAFNFDGCGIIYDGPGSNDIAANKRLPDSIRAALSADTQREDG